MPIALLLARPFAVLPTPLAGARALAPWTEILRIERVLAARARGAFLRRWFGPAVPVDGGYVRVALANRDALLARLGQPQAGGSAWADAPSTVTPVAGLVGLLGGILLSPVGLVGGLWQLIRFARFSLTTIVLAVAWVAGVLLWVALIGWPGATLLAAAVALPAVGLVGGAAVLAFLDEWVQGIGAFAASVTVLTRAGTTLIGQVTGPRNRVANPLLQAVLVLGDRLGALGAQVLGAVAFVIDIVGPRLVPAAWDVAAIRAAAVLTRDVLSAVVADVKDARSRFTSGDWAIGPRLTGVFDTVERLFDSVIETLDLGLTVADNTLTRGVDGLEAALHAYRKAVDAYLTDAFKRHPTVRNILTLTDRIGDKKKSGPKRGGPSPLSIPELPDFDKIIKDRPTSVIPPLNWKAVKAEADKPQRGVGLARVLRGVRARLAIGAMAGRPSVLAARRAELRDALATNRARLGELAGAVFDLLRTYLAPALWSSDVAPVEPVVRGLVDLVYADAAPAKRPLPVLRPDEPVPVRPVITRLRLHAPGATQEQVRAWRDTLVTALQGQSYVVAPAKWGR